MRCPADMWWRFVAIGLLAGVLAGALGGCVSRNPGFDVSVRDARVALRQMHRDRVPADRPIVVVGGWGVGSEAVAEGVARDLRRAFDDEAVVLAVGMGVGRTFEQHRDRALAELARFTALDQPVDVVGLSAGGLLARCLAMPGDTPESLPPIRIATLYTLGAPHQGTRLAAGLPLDPVMVAMLPGSDYLQRLDDDYTARDAEDRYPVVAYGRVGDGFGDFPNTGFPPGRLHWLPNLWFQEPHHMWADPRVMADLTRRLRGEPPFATAYTPLP